MITNPTPQESLRKFITQAQLEYMDKVIYKAEELHIPLTTTVQMIIADMETSLSAAHTAFARALKK